MTCGSCAVTTRLALSKVNGVNSADVSFEKKEAKVTYDPALVTPDRLELVKTLECGDWSPLWFPLWFRFGGDGKRRVYRCTPKNLANKPQPQKPREAISCLLRP